MKHLNHPPKHVDLTFLNLSIEVLGEFLKNYSKQNIFADSPEDQYKLIEINDQLQDLLNKLRIQNTFLISFKIEGK